MGKESIKTNMALYHSKSNSPEYKKFTGLSFLTRACPVENSLLHIDNEVAVYIDPFLSLKLYDATLQMQSKNYKAQEDPELRSQKWNKLRRAPAGSRKVR